MNQAVKEKLEQTADDAFMEAILTKEATYQLVKDHFDCEHRGKVMVKHIGETDMYFVSKKSKT